MEKYFCNKCGKCCNYIPVDFEQKIMFFDGIQFLTDEFMQMLKPIEKKDNITYCSCKNLKDNLCTKNPKPEICLKYPSSPFAYIPDVCGYSGEIFMKLEHEKQKVRKLKEEILHYEAIIKTSGNNTEIKQCEKIIKHHQALISKYNCFGAQDW